MVVKGDAEHRAGTLYAHCDPVLAGHGADFRHHVLAEAVNAANDGTIVLLQFLEHSDCCRTSNGVGVESASMDGLTLRDDLHDVAAGAIDEDGESAAERLEAARDVGNNTVKFLCSAQRTSHAGNGFVEDDHRPVLGGQLAQTFQVS